MEEEKELFRIIALGGKHVGCQIEGDFKGESTIKKCSTDS